MHLKERKMNSNQNHSIFFKMKDFNDSRFRPANCNRSMICFAIFALTFFNDTFLSMRLQKL